MKCTNCNQPVFRTPSELKKSKTGNVFCSRSCAAQFNNKTTPKRTASTTCQKCGIKIRAGGKYCGNCYKKGHYLKDKTLREATANRKDNNRYCNIRQASRKTYLRSDKPKQCAVCGYDVHIEVCHIKDIAEFNLNTPISEINHLDNLVALCRNHHWELDHNLLSIRQEGIGPSTCCL